MSKFDIITIEQALQVAGVKFTRNGNTLELFEGTKKTDGWKADTIGNYVSDFSNKGRSTGDVWSFISMELFNGDKAKGAEFLERKFNIKKDAVEYRPPPNIKKERPNTSVDFYSLPSITDDMNEYLHSRNIGDGVFSFIRNNKGRISLPIRVDTDGTIGNIQSRSIDGTGRYFLEKGGNSDGIFFEGLDDSNDKLIVVEGMTDFLSIRQYTANVVGLMNAGNKHQLKLIKELSNKYKIYLVPDNDKAGEGVIASFDNEGIKYSLFPTGDYGVKDIGDIVQGYGIGEGVITEIYSNSIAPISNISLAIKKVIQDRNKKRVHIGDKVIDVECRGFIRGTAMLINGQSTGGKTTFSLYILVNLLKNTKAKINYYSLETNIGAQLVSILAFYHGVTDTYVVNNIESIDKSFLDDRLFLYDNIRDFEGLCNNITETKPDVYFVDYVQKLKIEGIYDETAKMTFFANEIQNFLIDNGYSFGVHLSQVAMGNYQLPLLQRTPKNSGALLEATDIVINVGKEEGKYRIAFYKCKGGIGWGKVFDTYYTHNPMTYGIFPELKQEDVIKKGKDVFL